MSETTIQDQIPTDADLNAWAKETPKEEAGVTYWYTTTMSPVKPADPPAGGQQVIMNRKEFINFKEGLAGRRGLHDDDGKYSDDGSMPLSRALAVFDNASRWHLREVAFAIQGMEWANRSSLKPPEEFLSTVLGAYWSGHLTPDYMREHLEKFEEEIEVVRWMATEYLQQQSWMMNYKSKEVGSATDKPEAEEDEEITFKPQTSGDEMGVVELKSFSSLLDSWKGHFEQFKSPRFRDSVGDISADLKVARATFTEIEKTIDETLKAPVRPLLKKDLPPKKAPLSPVSPEDVPVRDALAKLLGEKRRELALKNPDGPPPTDREVMAAFLGGMVDNILAPTA